MNHRQWTCRCGVVNTWVMSTCELCTAPRPEAGEEPRPQPIATVSCWTCTRCKVRSPGQPTIMGLCGACHFEVNIRPHASRPTDVCDAVHPVDEDIVPCDLVEHATRSPHHHVAQHIKDFRRAMARISERFEEIKL